MTHPAVLVAGGGGSRGLTKKLLLWLLLVVQLCFIFCFWCIQNGLQEHTNESDIPGNGATNKKATSKLGPIVGHNSKAMSTGNRVNFINKKKNLKVINKSSSTIGTGRSVLENVNSFLREYMEFKTDRLINLTGIETEMINEGFDDKSLTQSVWCLREGTLNETFHDNVEISHTSVFWNIDSQRLQCRCKQHWHGRDCGQPEVMWRTMLLPGNQFKLNEPSQKSPPKYLIYLLEGYFNSLDFLELQIKAVDNVIDHFLIYWSSKRTKLKMLRAFKKKLNEILPTERFTLYHCQNKNIVTEYCNITNAYRYFQSKLAIRFNGKLQSSDLLVYTQEPIVMSREALQFLKYYSTPELPTWQFRLKYNVYGFYWQHPQRTHLNGFICSFAQLGNDFDPNAPELLANYNTKLSRTNIIGDLNHYGGWFCQFCEQPDEIIEELLERHDNPNQQNNMVQLPNATKNRFIDGKYLEYLIVAGTFIDGKTKLEKNRRYTDKYYAPSYAEQNNWKFGNLLTNFFEAMENDYVLEEDEGGMGF